MEKQWQIHLERCDDLIPNKNILIKTEKDEQLASNNIFIKKEAEDYNKSKKEEFIDFGHNIEIDEYKHNDSNVW